MVSLVKSKVPFLILENFHCAIWFKKTYNNKCLNIKEYIKEK